MYMSTSGPTAAHLHMRRTRTVLANFRLCARTHACHFHFGHCPGLGESSTVWFCAGRSPQLTLPELLSLGTDNRAIFPSQEPCLRGTLSLGSFSIGENCVGKNTWAAKE